ncbi:FMN-linked oxidoreductase [Hesseltinella vesiculosa]|uniref:FMN-linked oxidoreductase n=1 Tax=Hesseltinella vesiculosa TaxID=101127 RepID=A0A1X2G965_9FUNG|nr:FMN-linked oxidoreductase [Hesseltinella vesiculosa]
MSTPALLSPITIGDHELSHRVVLAPLTRLRNTEEGVPSDLTVEHYTQRASKGGLLISEATVIHPRGGGYMYAPGIYTAEQIQGWKRVTDAVHAKGGVIFCQLWHIGRATHSKHLPNNELPVSASPIAINGKNLFGDDYEVPHPLTKDEINQVLEAFAQGAKNALEAGFDGIELHGANGYLIDQFINTSSNERTDEYGGSIENRARLALEAVDAVVDAIGAKKVAIRLSPWSDFQDMKDDTPVETWSYITQQLQDKHADLAYIHYVEAREGGHHDVELENHESLDPFRQIWKGPFITAGGYTDPKKAIKTIEENPNNLLAFGRLFIANPDLPERIRNDWPLNKYHRPTFYSHEAEGYVDYPFYTPEAAPEAQPASDEQPAPEAQPATDEPPAAEAQPISDVQAEETGEEKAAVTESSEATTAANSDDEQPVTKPAAKPVTTKAERRKSKFFAKAKDGKCMIQ